MLTVKVPEGTVSPLHHLPLDVNSTNRRVREPQHPMNQIIWVSGSEHFYGSAPMHLDRAGLYFERIDTALSEEPHLPTILSEESKRYEMYLNHINQIADSSVGVLPVTEVTVKMKFKIIE